MGKWMDLAAKLEAESGTGDSRDHRDNNRPIVSIVPADLPPDIQAGLTGLKAMAAPRLLRPEVWPGVVSDALSLAGNGWVSNALALGWCPLDLFGAVTDRDGHNDADGLVLWLRDRPVLMMTSAYACVGDDTGRSYFNRCLRLGDTLLWDIGRGVLR